MNKFRFERVLAALGLCTIVVVALMLGLVANAEYEGIPYIWPWYKILFSAIMLLFAVGALTYSTIRFVNALIPERPEVRK